MPGKLYVVATPIGNLSDMTPRAVQVLSQADMIAAEDTRHSRVLLAHFNITTPSFSCHKFNEEKRGHFFISALLEGKNIALISDAGTPCISDPGHRLVDMAAAAGVEVVAVCGANAVVAALSVSGFDATRFMFIGFLPRGKNEQAEIFHMISKDFDWPVVFYESPLRIAKTLGWLAETYPAADICLCNDITKKFERVYRGTPASVLAELSENPSAQKGEYTCVARLNAKPKDEPANELSLEAQLVDIMVKHNCTAKEAANILHRRECPLCVGKRMSVCGIITCKHAFTNAQWTLPHRHTKPSKKIIYAATLRLKELFQ